MSSIAKVIPLSCWLLVYGCSSGSGSHVGRMDASGGEPDALATIGGAAGASATGAGGVQGTGVGGAAGTTSTGGTDSGGGTTGGGGLTATGGATPSAGSSSTGGNAGGATGGTNATGGTSNPDAATASGGVSAGGSSGTCGAGDPNLPAEPTIPPACTTLTATQNVPAGGVPDETSLDTSAIQKALTACPSGQAVKLATGGANNAFVTGPLTIPLGVTLWVDAGTTLYATRDPKVWGSATELISVSGANQGIVGDGVIDGQGGEPNIGSTQSWWDQNAGSSGNSPALIAVKGATNFTLYRITLHNSPKFHVKLSATGFVVWGVTIKAPSKATNSAGTALTYSNAHNTDGIDPGEAASNGTIVCSSISTGDDHIALKGSSATGVEHLVIAHNRFGAGHGMSIGSEFTGGVSDINVYDLSIDGLNMGTSGGSSNGIRIKSDSSRGGLVNNVTYSDICVRNLSNPILLTPTYSTDTGSFIPQYTNIKIENFHDVSGGSNAPQVTLDGYDSSHMNSITLDNVVIDGISSANVAASYTNVTLGPGNVNFIPSGPSVNVTNSISGSSTPNPCTNKWVTF
ncbi:MAG: glycosyl hydrolase family 28 protein [Polyangia bacterium]